jgi:hypothetical protein
LAVRDTVVGTLQKAAGAYERASVRIQDATVQGLATDDEQLLLQEAKTQVTQLEALQHTLSPDELRPSALRTEDIVAEVLIGVNRLERIEHWKRHALVPVWIFLGIMAVLFWLKRGQCERKRKP